MSEVCAGCEREGRGPGEATWSNGTDGYCWFDCDGCGWHLFDNEGESACAPGRAPELSAHAGDSYCFTCATLAPKGAGGDD